MIVDEPDSGRGTASTDGDQDDIVDAEIVTAPVRSPAAPSLPLALNAGPDSNGPASEASDDTRLTMVGFRLDGLAAAQDQALTAHAAWQDACRQGTDPTATAAAYDHYRDTVSALLAARDGVFADAAHEADIHGLTAEQRTALRRAVDTATRPYLLNRPRPHGPHHVQFPLQQPEPGPGPGSGPEPPRSQHDQHDQHEAHGRPAWDLTRKDTPLTEHTITSGETLDPHAALSFVTGIREVAERLFGELELSVSSLQGRGVTGDPIDQLAGMQEAAQILVARAEAAARHFDRHITTQDVVLSDDTLAGTVEGTYVGAQG